MSQAVVGRDGTAVSKCGAEAGDLDGGDAARRSDSVRLSECPLAADPDDEWLGAAEPGNTSAGAGGAVIS